MDNFSNKTTSFIIGLTGAIGTGKSLVRKMLEHKGALTIDADRLAHGAYAAGSKGFENLVRIFGNTILDQNGQVDRKRLGEIVFRDSHALHQLEALIHPLVAQAVERIIKLSPLPIIVIEAIKLLESDLKKHCDVIWEVSAHPEDIYQRLNKTRDISRAQIDERLSHQNFEKTDRSLIDLTIPNHGDIKALWDNLTSIWDDLAKSSVSFCSALNITSELLQPFQDHLLQKNSDLEVKAINEINRRGLVFLPVRNLDLNSAFFLGKSSDPTQLKEKIFLFSLWRYAEKSKKLQYYVIDIDNFSSSAAASLYLFHQVKGFIPMLLTNHQSQQIAQ
jgi:dephospho-CoA kinase